MNYLSQVTQLIKLATPWSVRQLHASWAPISGMLWFEFEMPIQMAENVVASISRLWARTKASALPGKAPLSALVAAYTTAH